MFHGVTQDLDLPSVASAPEGPCHCLCSQPWKPRRQVWGRGQRRSLPCEGDAPQLLAAPGQPEGHVHSQAQLEAAAHRA